MRHTYEGFIYNHVCVMSILDIKLSILPIGIRSICLEETELIQSRNIFVV